MNRITGLLGVDTPILLDGGMGTLLQDRGLEDGGAGELWNVDRPEVSVPATRRTPQQGHGFSPPTPSVERAPVCRCTGSRIGSTSSTWAAARIARSVADAYPNSHRILVAGDLGPTGELMAPLGTMDADQAQAFFQEQLAGLHDGGIDLVLIETMSDLAEVQAAIAAARAVIQPSRSSRL